MNQDNNSFSSDQYVELNKATYNALSSEYASRIPRYIKRNKDLSIPFVRNLSERFSSPIRVMDIGPGTGLDLAILSEQGFFVTGVDIAEEMLKLSRKTCPQAVLIHADVLKLSFHKESFEGLIAKASFHLFPKKDAMSLLAKMREWLVPKGIVFIATTLSDKPEEGIQPKSDYFKKLMRFRKQWTEDELLHSLSSAGFSIIEKTYDEEQTLGKKWINVFASKNKK